MSGGAFITQRPEQPGNEAAAKETQDLEAIVSGATQTSQSTLLLKKKKEMREVDEALELMKEEYKHRMRACDERQKDFEHKQLRMKEQVIKFEKFIQENDAKRQRAELKAKQERKLYERKRAEYAEQERGMAELEIENKRLMERLRRLTPYREYLERTVDAAQTDFEVINDLLNRYKTLKEANEDLTDTVRNHAITMDEKRQQLQSLQMETQNQLLVTNSKQNQYQQALERIRARLKRELEEGEKTDERRKSVVRETGQVVMAVKNLYNRCVTTMIQQQTSVLTKIDKNADMITTLDHLLTVINERIVDLSEVEAEYATESKDALDEDGEEGKDDGAFRLRDGSNSALGAASSSGGSDRHRRQPPPTESFRSSPGPASSKVMSSRHALVARRKQRKAAARSARSTSTAS